MEIILNGKTWGIGERSEIVLKELLSIKDSNPDVILVNGYMAKEDQVLSHGDEVSFIKRGVLPPEDELEALMCARHTPRVHEVFKQAKVAIAGLGGLGSNVAVALARVGIGELLLVDYDLVEPSNLNRQAYEIGDIGKSKCDALLASLKRINPYNIYKTINKKVEAKDVEGIFEGYDIVVEAFDNASYKAMLVNEILAKTNKPIVSASGMAGLYNPNTIKSKRIMKRLFLIGDGVHEAKAFEGLMAPRVIIAAGHQATMVCQILLNQIDIDKGESNV